nr:iron-containing alcohol dehydrogenase [Rhodovulum sulfidophilum]
MSVAGFDFAAPGRIVFGRGRAAEVVPALLGWGRRILLVRGGSVAFADRLAADLADAGAVVCQIGGRGEPDLPMLEAALAEARAFAPEAVVALGGGAVIDLGKALAALVPSDRPVLDHLEVVGAGLPLPRAPLPFAALPSTAGTGSEATRNAVIGVPGAGRKVSLRDIRMLPDLALVDPALTDGCPRAVTLASGLDASVQVIEPYLSCRATPLTDALCAAAIPEGLAALPRLMAAEDPAARDAMARVSLTGGLALANAGLGAVHGLAGVIGGRTGAPHGAICGRLLVPVLRANRAALADAGGDPTRIERVLDWIGAAFGGQGAEALDRFGDWIAASGLPPLPGMDHAAVAAEAGASSSMKGNPVPLSAATLAEVLAEA